MELIVSVRTYHRWEIEDENHRLPDSHEIKGENEINFLAFVPNCEIYQRHTLLFVA